MKLISYSYRGDPRAATLTTDGTVIDLERGWAERAARLSSAASLPRRLPSDTLSLLEEGPAALEAVRALQAWVGEQDAVVMAELRDIGAVFQVDEAGLRLHAPIPRPRKVLAIGLNYRAHAAETGATLPERPIVFAKASTCIVGPADPIQVPQASDKVDWEGELCVVIGRHAHHVAREQALDYVAGYMNGNDVSVRDWQRHSATWMMGKSFDTHGPTGPWLVTTDEVPDPASLHLQLWVNEALKQETSVDDLIFDVPALIEYLSTAFTLEPGDVIFTGTPSGVGAARQPQEWLSDGDVVRVSITGLGELRNPVVLEKQVVSETGRVAAR